MVVYGFGERKTPKPFVVACDKFVYTEVLRKEEPSLPEAGTRTATSSTATQTPIATPKSNGAPIPKPLTGLESPVDLISQAIEQGADEAGWTFLGAVGNYVTKIQPDFDPRLYACRKLSDLLKKYPDRFETSERGSPGSPAKMVYARVIPAKVRERLPE